MILQLLAWGQLGYEWQELLERHHNPALDFQAQIEASYHEAEHISVLTNLAQFLRLKAGQTVIYKQDYFLQLWILHLEDELVSLRKRTNVRVRLKSFYSLMNKGMGGMRRLEGKDGQKFSDFRSEIVCFRFYDLHSITLIGSPVYQKIPASSDIYVPENCFSHCRSLNF